MAKSTKDAIERIGPGEREVLLFDDSLSGFDIRGLSSGRRSYVLQDLSSPGNEMARGMGSTKDQREIHREKRVIA